MAASLHRHGSASLTPSPEFEARYELGELLGKGGFGSVYSCRCKATGRRFACKVLNREYVKQSLGVEPSKEAGIMRTLANQHYGVVQLAESLEDDVHAYVVMEYCAGGSLLDVLKTKGAMPESSSRVVLGQIAAALAFCHSKRILHLDIKPENIFFLDPAADALYSPDVSSSLTLASLFTSLNVRARLADFGMATVLKPGKKVRGDVGSPHFKAPEVIAGKKFGLEVDVWSLGVVLCVMLTGTVPFLGTSNHDVVGLNKAILSGIIDFSNARWWGISEEAKDLVKRMLQVDPAKRITAAGVLEHPWFTAGLPVGSSYDEVEMEALPAFARDLAVAPEQCGKAPGGVPLLPVQTTNVAGVQAVAGRPAVTASIRAPVFKRPKCLPGVVLGRQTFLLRAMPGALCCATLL